MSAIKDYLLQLALIATLIFTYHIFFKEWATRHHNEKLVMSAFWGLSILLCMSFPAHADYEIRLDIRVVPLLLGTLYGGVRTGLFLSALIVLYRFYIGADLGFYNTILTLAIGMPPILVYSRSFIQAPKNKKIRIAVVLAACYSLVGILWSSIIRDISLKVILQIQISHLFFSIVVVCFFTLLNEVITEMIKKNQQLQSEAERLRVISDLTSVFAHEIRNPMQVTRGFLQLLNEPDLPAKKKAYIHHSIEELDRANAIINDLLAFGKPSTDDNQRIEVSSELRRLESMIQTLALSRNVEIQTDFHDGCWIHACPQKLNQALIQILKNAIESMPNGGVVRFTCAPANDGFIEICVKDEGIGMTKEQIEKLGSPYYSLKENGTGLSMMVSLQIIRNLQGKVRITSKINVGTEFTICLPSVNEAGIRSQEL